MAEGRDIIVIGGSAGAIDAVSNVLDGVPPDIPAALFVVIHSGRDAPGFLTDIFSKRTKLKVGYAEDNEPIELGHVYVAPSDRHLLIKPGVCRIVRGPKENNFRPAIDPLFRSAAYTYGPRVIGVLLSGMLDDGAHGMYQIGQEGGVTVVQAPDDCAQREMPLSAIERVGVDHVLPSKEIGPLLHQLAQQNGFQAAGPSEEQADVTEGVVSALEVPGVENPSSPFICPDCGGSLWEVRDGNLLRYRCHAGHGVTAETLLESQSDEIEQALWTSVRLLEEQADLQKRLASQWHAAGNQWLRTRFEDNAEDRQGAAKLIRGLLTGSRQRGHPEKSPAVRREYGT
jgi:two-component system chemotaxis response regulator CheB